MAATGGNATVTAKQGIANAVTTKVINGITRIEYDLVNQMIKLFKGGDYQEFDLAGNTTFTLTFSSGVYTLTIS